MGFSRSKPSVREAALLAQKIAEMPDRHLPLVMGEMMYKRELFRTASALNDLVSDYPEHRPAAVKALDKMQLWCGG